MTRRRRQGPQMLPSDGSAGIVGSSRIAVLVPCYNGEAAIGKVVAGPRCRAFAKPASAGEARPAKVLV
jgi:hypothetical protein